MKGAIVLLGLIALIGAALGIALDDFRDDIEDDMDSAVSMNESFTLDNTTAIGLNGVETLISCDAVHNGTSGTEADVLIPSGNYTCSDGVGITWIQPETSLASTLYVTYTYGVKNEPYNTTTSGLFGVSNSTDYLDTIGTIIGIAVLIGIVVMAFSFGRR